MRSDLNSRKVLLSAFLLISFIILASQFTTALSSITINSPQSTVTYTTKSVQLNVSFNETYFSSWYSLNNQANTTICSENTTATAYNDGAVNSSYPLAGDNDLQIRFPASVVPEGNQTNVTFCFYLNDNDWQQENDFQFRVNNGSNVYNITDDASFPSGVWAWGCKEINSTDYAPSYNVTMWYSNRTGNGMFLGDDDNNPGGGYSYYDTTTNNAPLAGDNSMTWNYLYTGDYDWMVNVTITTDCSLAKNKTITASPGENNLTVYVNDSFGNINLNTTQFNVESTPPLIKVNSPLDNTISDNTPLLNITINELNLDSVWISLDGENNISYTHKNGTADFAHLNLSFADDFSNYADNSPATPIWVNPATFITAVIDNGTYKLHNETALYDALAYISNFNQTNYTGSSRVMIPPGQYGGAYLSPRFIDVNNKYEIVLDFDWGTVSISKVVGGVWSSLASRATNTLPIPITITKGNWYTLGFKINGSNISAYLNGQFALNVTDSDLDYTGFSLIALDDKYSHTAYFDNIEFYNELSDGPHNITVYANDTAGNQNSTTVHFIIDTTAPVITLLSPTNSTMSINNNNITFTYNVTDLSNISNCSLIINNNLNQTKTSITKNTTQNFTINNLGGGSHNWKISCRDIVNNVQTSRTRTLSIIKATDFTGDTTNLSEVNVSNITNLIIDKPSYGKINFSSESIDLSNGADLDKYVDIRFNKIEIDSTALPVLNKSSILYLYNLPFSNPVILRDGAVCPNTICTKINYSKGTLIFNVTQFSTYSAREISTSSSGSNSCNRELSIIAPKEINFTSEEPLQISITIKNTGSCTLSNIDTKLNSITGWQSSPKKINILYKNKNQTINFNLTKEQFSLGDYILTIITDSIGVHKSKKIIIRIKKSKEENLKTFGTRINNSIDSTKANQTIFNTQRKIKIASERGINTGKAQDLLNQAIFYFSAKNYLKTEELAQQADELIQQMLNQYNYKESKIKTGYYIAISLVIFIILFSWSKRNSKKII